MTVARFSLAGIPVEVGAAFFLIVGALAWRRWRHPHLMALWLAAAFVSILWHELGHAATLGWFGHDSSIRLWALGGLTVPRDPISISAGEQIAISLAGPGAGFAAGGLAWLVARQGLRGRGRAARLGRIVIADLVWINVLWGLVNLLPVPPLDGFSALGSAVAIGLEGPLQAAAVATGLAGVVAAGYALRHPVVGLLRWGMGRPPPPSGPTATAVVARGWRRLEAGQPAAAAEDARRVLAAVVGLPLQVAGRVRGQAARLLMWADLMRGHLEEAAATVTSHPAVDAPEPVLHGSVLVALGGPDAAVGLLEDLVAAVPGDATCTLLAGGLLEADRLADAVTLVTDGPRDQVGPNTRAVVGRALFQAGRFEEAARIGQDGFEELAHPTTAYNVACCWSRAGDPARALAWLERAVEAGFTDLSALDASADLAAVRELAGYRRLRSRLADPATT